MITKIICHIVEKLLLIACKDVTCFELITKEGRTYTNYNIGNIEFSFQDNDRTLKIFITNNQDE